ncbi:MAG: prepilin peptidase, partial [Oscillospiraceae bacterium]|nr:prepilin peptidase [Oscillospiraceae bacterium]
MQDPVQIGESETFQALLCGKDNGENMDTFTILFTCFIIFMLGASLGSFFNVLLCRLPLKEGFVKSRSYCPECKKTLHWYELLPVISFIVQKGRCRGCFARIKPQYLIMELFCGAANVWAFLALRGDFTAMIGVSASSAGTALIVQMAIAFILFPVLVALSVEDIKITEIPYWCTGVIAALGVIATVLSFFLPTKVVWYEHFIGMVIIAAPFAVFCFLGAMGGG